MTFAYPACFYPDEEGGYCVIVPDFGSSTQGDDMKDAIFMAEDLIAGLIVSAIEEGKSIPTPSAPNNDMLEPEEYGEGFISVVLVDMDKKEKEFRGLNKAVKKTLTIPQWVNERATAMRINFSQTLTDALISKISE
jgi:Uncharacterized conserved protein